jgi:3-deoxy-manno-octulosonate cytidylyltransferase (CMP-KDO synthetase)
MKKPLIIIPARYASTRFPGKPLAIIHGKPMIQHVFERCKIVCSQVFVATDDDRIVDAVKSFGGVCIFTSPGHQSGTDRCAEAALKLSFSVDFDLVINVQGDEPFIEPIQIEQIIRCFDDPETEIATLITPIQSAEILFNQNKVKVVKSANGNTLYFSRLPIPFQRDVPENNWLDNSDYYLHIGMYAFRPSVLQAITKLEPSVLEKAEKLEQLRWLENGYHIKTAITKHTNFGIDTPADLEEILNLKK